MNSENRIPRDSRRDYTDEMAKERREFLTKKTGEALEHTGQYSIDTESLPGNVENFIGIVQMPVGVAGPLLINGEHAQGEFFVPLATTEGTLVASYSRGMRVISESGGCTTTVVEQYMQRAPAFIFDNSREAREFGQWIDDNFDQIKSGI